MALDPNIPLSAQAPDLLGAITRGFAAGEAIRNAPLMRSLLEQRQLQGQQALQAGEFAQQQATAQQQQQAVQTKGAFANRLARDLMNSPPALRQDLLNRNADAIQAFGVDPSAITDLSDEGLFTTIQATNQFAPAGGEKAVALAPGQRLVGAQTGRVIAEGAPVDTTEKIQPKVDKLRGRVDKFTGDLRKVDASFRKIQAAPATASGDLSLIFNFMKMLDPGSTVREGEFANAQNAAGVPSRILNLYNRVTEGTRLGDDQRREFVETANTAFSSQQASADQSIANVLQQADEDNVPRSRVLGAKALREFEKRAAEREIKATRQPQPQEAPQQDIQGLERQEGGQLMIDASGNRAMVFPDGTFREIP